MLDKEQARLSNEATAILDAISRREHGGLEPIRTNFIQRNVEVVMQVLVQNEHRRGDKS